MKRKSWTWGIPHHDLRTDLKRLETEIGDTPENSMQRWEAVERAMVHVARRGGNRKRRVQWIAKMADVPMYHANWLAKEMSR